MQDSLFDELKERLTPLFLKDPRIIVGYLFGSSAQGITHKRSDIDLAILLAFGKNFTLDDLLDLEVNITLALKTERYDLIVANKAPLILKFRIISTGKLIYIANDNLRCEFEERVMQEYYDFLPRLNEFNRQYFVTLKENYLSR